MKLISTLRRHIGVITLVAVILGMLVWSQKASANQQVTETVSNGTFTLTVVYDDTGIVKTSYTGDCSRLGGNYEVRTMNFEWNWDRDGDFVTPRVWCQDPILSENTQCRLEITIKRPGTVGWGTPETTPWSTATGCLDCTPTPTNTLPTSTPIPATSTPFAWDGELTPEVGETSTPVITPTIPLPILSPVPTNVLPNEQPTVIPTEAPKTCPAEKFVIDAGALSTCDENASAVQIKLNSFYVKDNQSDDHSGLRYNKDGSVDLFWDHGDIFKMIPVPDTTNWDLNSAQAAIEAYSTAHGLATDYLVKAEFNPDTGFVSTKLTWKMYKEIFGGGEFAYIMALASDRGDVTCPEWHRLNIQAHWFNCPDQGSNQTASTPVTATEVAPTTVAPTRVPERQPTPGQDSSIELSTILSIAGFLFLVFGGSFGIFGFLRSRRRAKIK